MRRRCAWSTRSSPTQCGPAPATSTSSRSDARSGCAIASTVCCATWCRRHGRQPPASAAGSTQVQMHARVGLTFARGLRSVLRQDPDVVLVGEVRDPETAKLALEASMTGHLVLTTLHTNSAPGALTRLTDMGVEPFLVASSLSLVVAQRLVRRVCRECSGPYTPPARVLTLLGIDAGDLEDGQP